VAGGAAPPPAKLSPRGSQSTLQYAYQLEKWSAPVAIPAPQVKPHFALWERKRQRGEIDADMSFVHFLFLQA